MSLLHVICRSLLHIVYIHVYICIYFGYVGLFYILCRSLLHICRSLLHIVYIHVYICIYFGYVILSYMHIPVNLALPERSCALNSTSESSEQMPASISFIICVCVCVCVCVCL